MKNKIQELKKEIAELRKVFNIALEENNRLRGIIEEAQKVQDEKVKKLKEIEMNIDVDDWQRIIKEIDKIFGGSGKWN